VSGYARLRRYTARGEYLGWAGTVSDHRPTDADPNTVELLRSERVDDILDAIVSGCAGVLPYSDRHRSAYGH
jgi:hypothetical protein